MSNPINEVREELRILIDSLKGTSNGGIPCPQCGNATVDSNVGLLTSTNFTIGFHCPNCMYRGERPNL